MKKSRFTDEQIVAIVREAEKGEQTVEQVCRSHGIGTSFKKALADRVLEIEVLKEINAKKWRARRLEPRRRATP
jgi:putative transposase